MTANIEEIKINIDRISGLTKFPIQRLNYVKDSLYSCKTINVERLRRKNEQKHGEEEKINDIQKCLTWAIKELSYAIQSIEQLQPDAAEYISAISE